MRDERTSPTLLPLGSPEEFREVVAKCLIKAGMAPDMAKVEAESMILDQRERMERLQSARGALKRRLLRSSGEWDGS